MPNPKQPPKHDYLAPYQRAIAAHGPSFESTLWASKPMQIQRFDILAEALDPTGLTIIDAGSALADFPARLTERAIQYKACIALEAIQGLHHEAAGREIPRTTHHLADFATEPDAFERFKPDAVYFSGSLNTFSQEHALAVLKRAWNAATVGIAFNFLSARHHRKNAPDPTPAVRFEPLPILDWALSQTPNVRFRQDYFQGHDATIAMTRPDPPRQNPAPA